MQIAAHTHQGSKAAVHKDNQHHAKAPETRRIGQQEARRLGQIIRATDIDLSLSRAPEEHGPEPTFQAARDPLGHVQVRSRDSEQEKQDCSHEDDEVEQDVVAVRDEVRYDGGEEAGDSPRRHGGGGAQARVAEPGEAESEPKLTRPAGLEGALVGGDGSVVFHGCDLGDRFRQLGVGEPKGDFDGEEKKERDVGDISGDRDTAGLILVNTGCTSFADHSCSLRSPFVPTMLKSQTILYLIKITERIIKICNIK